jgi:hypothetical protein
LLSITRLGTFDDLVRGRPAEIAALAWHLRDLIGAVHPDVVEVPRTGEGVAAYGWGEKKMSESYAYIAPQRTTGPEDHELRSLLTQAKHERAAALGIEST